MCPFHPLDHILKGLAAIPLSRKASRLDSNSSSTAKWTSEFKKSLNIFVPISSPVGDNRLMFTKGLCEIKQFFRRGADI